MKSKRKTVIVTGGTRGIGRAIAETLHQAGLRVVITGRRKADVEAAAKQISSGGSVTGLKADARKQSDIKEMIDKTIDIFGRLDVLVNNAGITRDNIIFNTSVQDWEAVIQTNLTAPFLGIKYAAKAMMRHGWGRIIKISSIAARGGGAGQAAYAASKSGLNALTRVAAVELGRKNITVNAIAPGLVRTRMTEAILNLREVSMSHAIPLRRIGLPAEIAGAVLFLISDNAAYITGQVIPVSGGLGLTYKIYPDIDL